MKLQEFFWVCAGADVNTLREPRSIGDRTRYTSTGVAILLTAGWATISCAFALQSVFHNWTIFAFALYWGTLIFNLDRYFVATLRKRRGEATALLFLRGFIRVLLAVAISVVVATPLVLKIFEPDLDRVLKNENAVRAETHRHAVENMFQTNEFIDEKVRIDSALAALDSAAENAIRRADAEGHGAYGKYGAGFFYSQDTADRNKKVRTAAVARDSAARQKRALDVRIDSLRQLQNTEFDKLIAADANSGLLAQLHAFGVLIHTDFAVRVTHFFLTFVLVMVETSPVLLKLMASPGPYESKIDNLEDRVYAEDKAEIDALTLSIADRMEELTTRSETARSRRNSDATAEINFANDQRTAAYTQRTDELSRMKAVLSERFIQILNAAIVHERLRNAEETMVTTVVDQLIDDVNAKFEALHQAIQLDLADMLHEFGGGNGKDRQSQQGRRQGDQEPGSAPFQEPGHGRPTTRP